MPETSKGVKRKENKKKCDPQKQSCTCVFVIDASQKLTGINSYSTRKKISFSFLSILFIFLLIFLLFFFLFYSLMFFFYFHSHRFSFSSCFFCFFYVFFQSSFFNSFPLTLFLLLYHLPFFLLQLSLTFLSFLSITFVLSLFLKHRIF